MTQTWFRLQHNTRADTILDPQTWESTPWENPELVTKPCPDCVHGRVYLTCVCGDTGECRACREDYTYDDCDTCNGKGEVMDVRTGVSVCRSLDDLVRYFDGREVAHGPNFIAELELVELAGPLSDDDDYDAEDGAHLILPERIVSVQPVPAGLRAVIEDQEA